MQCRFFSCSVMPHTVVNFTVRINSVSTRVHGNWSRRNFVSWYRLVEMPRVVLASVYVFGMLASVYTCDFCFDFHEHSLAVNQQHCSIVCIMSIPYLNSNLLLTHLLYYYTPAYFLMYE